MPELRNAVEQQFYSFLLEKGYPASSIVFEYPFVFGKREFRPDFLITDPVTQQHLAVIEVRADVMFAMSHSREKFRTFAESFRNIGLPFYIVVWDGSNRFRLMRASDSGSTEEVPEGLFPNFEALLASRVATKKEEITQEKEDVRDEFKFVCLALAFFSLVLAALDCWSDFFGVRVLNVERIGLIGAAVALVIVPYAQKFKGLGFEYERFANPKREDKKT